MEMSLEMAGKTWKPRIDRLLGFDSDALKTWHSFVDLIFQPADSSSLAVVRTLFGLLMIVDTIEERGLSDADLRWGDPDECRFPLLNFMEPLPLEWMCMLYLAMLFGAFGIAVGAKFRVSCAAFIVPYWYILLLDKTAWNNHSYLFGILGSIFLFSDAHRFWSFDAWTGNVEKNRNIPVWNYAILRFQLFLLYFYAGLKKIDYDWLTGESMTNLSAHWVFEPMRPFLTDEQIDLWIIHVFGFLLDLTVGFLMYIDQTRPLASIFLVSFHLMNAQMFKIGMFPYVCLATMPLFFTTTGLGDFSKALGSLLRVSNSRAGIRRETGYNNWTNGLYGYSWDMMVHNWISTRATIIIVNKDDNEEIFLDPSAWVVSDRWRYHADMAVQYAQCLKKRVNSSQNEMRNYSIHFDVWMSLNGRFLQRMYDPKVDILEAPWSPFEATPWIMPLLSDLSDQRDTMTEIENVVHSWPNRSSVLFVADFPGLIMDNFLHKDFGFAALTILTGRVQLEQNGVTQVLSKGETATVLSDQFHKIHTISTTPSTFMYVYRNESAGHAPEPSFRSELPPNYFSRAVQNKFNNLSRASAMLYNAVLSIFFNVPMPRRVQLHK